MNTNDPIAEVSSWNWQKTLTYHQSLSALRRYESEQTRKQIDTGTSESPSTSDMGVDSTESATTPNVRKHDTVITT